MNNLNQFHDAVLTAVSMDWESGELILEFCIDIDGRRHLRIVARGLTSLNCTRLFPWGKSVSVNTVSIAETTGQMKLLIEMQSGDLIEAITTDISII